MESIRVLASLDILGCEAVKLVRGVPGSGLRLGDPLRVAERLHSLGATWLHVVDLDGALRGRPSRCVLQLVSRLASGLGLRVQLGGGLRSLEAVEEAAAAGAERVVIGSAWLSRPGFLDEAAELGVGVVAAVEEHQDGLTASHGWRGRMPLSVVEAVGMLHGRRIAGILYTQVFAEGGLGGFDRLRARRLAEAAPRGVALIYSGGVSSREDLEALAGLGYRLAVVGMALHTWRLNPIGVLA